MNQIQGELLALVPARIALRYSVFPLAGENGLLKLLAPGDLSRQDKEELRILLGKELVFQFASRLEIEASIQKAYGIGAGLIETLAQEKEEEPAPIDFEVIDKEGEEASVARLVNEFLMDALKHRASDIHIEPFERTFRIRYRVDGLLEEPKVSDRIRSLAPSLISRIKIMARLDIAEKRLPQEGRIKIKQKEGELDLRVAILPSSFGEAIVIRILKSLELLNLPELGFDEDALKKIRHELAKPQGMILVTGPTGSGKTTTLYACLKELNEIERKIITIEDPIEYKLPGIIQVQVNPKIGLDFARALRSMLRNDPDCLMVGEIRDQETAEIAIRSALTGHLVLSTFHTNDAPSAVTRLLEMGIEPYLIASSLHAVIAQRLVRKVCVPCEKCAPSGFFGRTAIYEFMAVTESLRSLMAQASPADLIRQKALEEGMRGIWQDGMMKAQAGLTAAPEIERVFAACDT